MARLTLLSLVLWGLPFVAQAQTRISPEAFLDRVMGKTVKFYDYSSDHLVGLEQFLSPTTSVWQEWNEPCVYGEISIEGGQLCFLYRELRPDPVCWWPFEMEDRLYVRLASPQTQIQEVRDITPDPLACHSAPVS